jgi:Carbohydrate-selective porin, OprB family/S-layer homology domain
MVRSWLVAATVACLSSTAVLPVAALPDISVSTLLGNNQTSVRQVSSVSELTDVYPNSWAFQALKSLVERYGCVEGYPAKKYLGNRPLSRYEFAAGLDACLDKVGEQIAAATSNLATKDDLAAVQRLQEEFTTELAALSGQTDILEAKTRELEQNNFSPTVRLTGTALFAATGGSAGGTLTTPNPLSVGAFGDAEGAGGTGDEVDGKAANATVVSRTRLGLTSVFPEGDFLFIRLAATSGTASSDVFGGAGGLAYSGGPNNGLGAPEIDRLVFSGKLGDNFRYYVGPAVEAIDYVDKNSFSGEEGSRDFSSSVFVNNPLLFTVGAAPGASFTYDFANNLTLRVVYSAAEGGQSFGYGSGGLTGGGTQLFTELEVHPSESTAIRLQYSSATEQNTVFGARLPDESIVNSHRDAFGINAEWFITPALGIFGRYGTASTAVASNTDSYSPLLANTFQVGIALPDLFAPGNTLALAVGQPARVTSGTRNGLSLVPSGNETDFELYYKFLLDNGITLTPDLQVITQPSNIANNPTLVIGTLRVVYPF